MVDGRGLFLDFGERFRNENLDWEREGEREREKSRQSFPGQRRALMLKFYLSVTKYVVHGENFMAIITTRSVVIWFSTGTRGIFATLVYVFTMRMVIYDKLSIAIIPTLSTSILFCNLCYILLWISQRSVVKIAIRIYQISQHWYTQKKLIHCVAIFTILYGHYYPPHSLS